jgi:hypothetical protein
LRDLTHPSVIGFYLGLLLGLVFVMLYKLLFHSSNFLLSFSAPASSQLLFLLSYLLYFSSNLYLSGNRMNKKKTPERSSRRKKKTKRNHQEINLKKPLSKMIYMQNQHVRTINLGT